MQEKWEFACQYHPEINQIHADLSKLNASLGFLLKAVIVEGQQFKDAKKIAGKLESDFLETKFSRDKILKSLAKYAILSGEIQFAKDLNKALKILGINSKQQIISRLSDDYPEFLFNALTKINETDLIPEDNVFQMEHSKNVDKFAWWWTNFVPAVITLAIMAFIFLIFD